MKQSLVTLIPIRESMVVLTKLLSYLYLRLLIEAEGYDELVNELSADNCTALYYAVCVGNLTANLEVVKLLLEKGAKKTINEQDYKGQTPLHMAAISGDL